MTAGILALGLCASAAPASAQMQWTDRAFLNVNGGVQVGSHDLDRNATFTLYDEDGQLQTSQSVKSGGLFDISGGYKLWKNWAVGIGYSYTGSDSDSSVHALVPDPGFFDRPRPLDASASGLDHSEHAINLDATWMMPFTDKIDLGLSLGPTIFLVRQEVVSSVSVAEPGPTLASVNISREHETTVGLNFGLDVNYMLTPRYGAGLLARYSWGSVDIDNDSLTVGGFQIGAGFRMRF
ncbi:MAG TPA: outer membrane beta-barrel protein [Gemmatimonadaceae bacterium]|nr:outer membrane beta-barrel protein [Vicinamibacterales bacterium]